VDLLIIVSDPTAKGIKTAARINTLVDELNLEVDRRALVINRTQGSDEDIKTAVSEVGVEVTGLVPQDPKIFEFDLKGKPVLELPEDSVAVTSYFAILDSLKIP
jgi:CO dehydrogenase maturation factor